MKNRTRNVLDCDQSSYSSRIRPILKFAYISLKLLSYFLPVYRR